MGTINKKRTKPLYSNEAHKNWMAGDSYQIGNPLLNLQLAAASCFFGEPMYYHRGDESPACSTLVGRDLDYLRDSLQAIDPQEWRGLSPKQMIESAIDKALEFDAEGTLEIAAGLRNEGHIRTTPQVILVRAANHPACRGTGIVPAYASRIMKRADEPAVCLAYQLATYGAKAPIPNSLKKALRNVLASYNEYQLGKYRMDSHEVKTVDVVNLVHPSRTPAIDKLVRGELRTTNLTWEAIRSAGGTWESALGVMGHMALLRNLRNLEHSWINPSLYLDKLKVGVSSGQQLPFRYYSAYKACQGAGCSSQTLDAIEECLELSYANTPHFNGKVISLCDNSGSAWGVTTSSIGTMSIAEIANLTGIITAKAADEGYVGIFGNDLEILQVRQKSSIFDVAEKCTKSGHGIGGATENGIWIFWNEAIKQKAHYDHVFVYSDMQAGHGGLYGLHPDQYKEYRWNNSTNIDVPKLINKYRQVVNPNINVYLVQVAGYQDTLVPEFYKKTYILGGWSEGLLRFAQKMTQLGV